MWTVPRSVLAMVDAPPQWAPLVKEFAYVLHDLGAIEVRQLPEKASLRTGLLALKMAYVEEVPPRVLDPITGGAIADTEWERHILRSITECLRLTPTMPKASLRRTRPDRWETLMETVAETWKREARMEGRMEGHAQAVLRMLELRFGALPARAREQVRNGSAEELDAWTEAVLSAKSLEEVLDAQAGHH